MKHPDREEWIPFLFGEAKAAERKRLSQHLEQCPECTREIAGWRRSLAQLNRWPIPKAPQSPVPLFQPALKWALAACVIFGLGIVIGRQSGPSEAQFAALRSQVEASVRSSLMAQMNDALESFESETSNAVRAAELRLARGSSAESERVWHNLVDILNTARAEDNRNFAAHLQQLQDRHDAQFVDLRKDLETLASTADEEIRSAQLKLIQLAANSTPLTPVNN